MRWHDSGDEPTCTTLCYARQAEAQKTLIQPFNLLLERRTRGRITFPLPPDRFECGSWRTAIRYLGLARTMEQTMRSSCGDWRFSGTLTSIDLTFCPLLACIEMEREKESEGLLWGIEKETLRSRSFCLSVTQIAAVCGKSQSTLEIKIPTGPQILVSSLQMIKRERDGG
ncbi:uncharacterized protein BJX67DRAFT_231761 [Aspergillus lucknowensis]|uniref:Uncharacterized protein n=1 Tax=Aspergillus lucknowensis TaxID=176173 RepID=A0ABR4LH89_9EURO